RWGVVTNSHRSPLVSRRRASARLPASTESRSGESRNASPGGRAGAAINRSGGGPSFDRAGAGEGVRTLDWRVSPGSRRSPRNHGVSDGWQTSTGSRVVGRSTPERLTGAWTKLLTSVDFPAPVEPLTTTSSGAAR